VLHGLATMTSRSRTPSLAIAGCGLGFGKGPECEDRLAFCALKFYASEEAKGLKTSFWAMNKVLVSLIPYFSILVSKFVSLTV